MPALFRGPSASQHPDYSQLGDVLHVEVPQILGDFSVEVVRRDKTHVVVIARFQAVVAVTAVSEKLEALGRAQPTFLLLLVTPLQDGKQVVRAPVAKFVVQKVRHFKVGELTFENEPA